MMISWGCPRMKWWFHGTYFWCFYISGIFWVLLPQQTPCSQHHNINGFYGVDSIRSPGMAGTADRYSAGSNLWTIPGHLFNGPNGPNNNDCHVILPFFWSCDSSNLFFGVSLYRILIILNRLKSASSEAQFHIFVGQINLLLVSSSTMLVACNYFWLVLSPFHSFYYQNMLPSSEKVT